MLRDCLELYTPYYEIVHGVRQKNIVADRLAALTYSHRQRHEYFGGQDLPDMVRMGYLQIYCNFETTDLDIC